MTSTSGPGFSLMQEGISSMANAELPGIIVDVQRGGPGSGTIRQAQQDYLQSTRGGGHGDYRTLVLAPNSSQECCDLTQLAFHLGDKYRNPVIILSDAIIGRLREIVNVETIDFGPLPYKNWAIRGAANQKDGKRRIVDHSADLYHRDPDYVSFMRRLSDKIEQMSENELRFEKYQTEDAELVLVAYGYTSRVAKEAVNMARADGIKAGLIRPITVWPFPYNAIKEKANQGSKFLVVEDSLGQMIDDVLFAVEGKTDVHFVGVLDRHIPTDGGMILPDKVYEKIKNTISE
jgi:2-oxoglutarate ferredoxin oxidoreductase subunit alpha